ncbi:MAG: S-methyl-5'-thioadenosine phosphorylase [Actinomycetota bacterium]|nr:S-methyl-5'-thioadenosine phosphorylase [Actinomycetota bacterium]
MAAGSLADIGVIGGSGFYRFGESSSRQVSVDTPYGPPSAPITVFEVGGRSVAFLPRHGLDHELPPHLVNYRANLWALHSIGVGRVIGPCAAGSLHPSVEPGHFVVLDQLVDRTWGRADTYVSGAPVRHLSFADPYCPELRRVLVAAAAGIAAVHDGGTVVVVQGPRFSTRAESNWYRAAGWEVINMTQYPEAYLARELGLCYSGLALITDYDTGLEGVEGIAPVTMDQVFAMLAANVSRTRDLLSAAIPAIPAAPGCHCSAQT